MNGTTVKEARAGFAGMPTWEDGGLVLLVGLFALLLRFLGAVIGLAGEFGREAAVLTAGFVFDSADRAEHAVAARVVRRSAERMSDPAAADDAGSMGTATRYQRPVSNTPVSADSLVGVRG